MLVRLLNRSNFDRQSKGTTFADNGAHIHLGIGIEHALDTVARVIFALGAWVDWSYWSRLCLLTVDRCADRLFG